MQASSIKGNDMRQSNWMITLEFNTNWYRELGAFDTLKNAVGNQLNEQQPQNKNE